MLREFQDEIKALRAQLDATQRGVMIRADGTVSLCVCLSIYALCSRHCEDVILLC